MCVCVCVLKLIPCKALEINERIKRKGYEQAFINFADKARDPTHFLHGTYQQMIRINHHRGGAPKVTPFGVNIYGILSQDAHQDRKSGSCDRNKKRQLITRPNSRRNRQVLSRQTSTKRTPNGKRMRISVTTKKRA